MKLFNQHILNPLLALMLPCALALNAQDNEPTQALPQQAGTIATGSDAGTLYIIKRGDTLWDLARAFLGDNFSWPTLWQRNRYISDPHWIYPGKQLYINQNGITDPQSVSNPSAQPPASPRGQSRLSFELLTDGLTYSPEHQGSGDVGSDLDFGEVERLVRRQVLTGEFLSHVPFLLQKKDSRGELSPGNGEIDKGSSKTIFHQFDEVGIKTFDAQSYQVGDTFEVYRSERFVNYNNAKANVVRRIGYGRVVSLNEGSAQAQLFKVWDMVKPGDRIGPPTPFSTLPVGSYAATTQGVGGTVIQKHELDNSPYLYDALFIDQGHQSGVKIGDLFAIYPSPAAAQAPVASHVACAAYVGEDYSTVVVVKLTDTSLENGNRVQLVRTLQ
jgi:hypothetical protein